MRPPLVVAIALQFLLAWVTTAYATQVKSEGYLLVAPKTPIAAICTDPVLQQVLDQDLAAQHRGLTAGSVNAVTLTVTLYQKVLKPGVTLEQAAPGNPSVVALLRELGATPLPPMGDGDDRPVDPFAAVARLEALRPEDPLTRQFRNQQAMSQSMNQGLAPFMPGYQEVDPSQQYSTAIIARVTSSGATGGLTVAALLSPGDNIRDAKELIAEEIANVVLH